MSQHRTAIVFQFQRLAAEMPLGMVEMLAAEIEKKTGTANWDAARRSLLHLIPQPHYRSLADDFLDTWKTQAADLSPQAVALALLAAAASEKARQEHQAVELVWTGPDTQVIPLRRTEQAILQVIDSASRRLTVVSYAVYNIPRICEALIRAANRGVAIAVIVESPDRLEGQNTYNTLRALGAAVAERANVYLWPLDRRERDGDGKPGILHVKCAVADGRWLFLSSANLTEYAFTLNMELGLLLVGGGLPVQVETLFEQLIADTVLARV